MTQVVLPNRPVPGDPEDISELIADFDAILTVLNGDIRNDNLAAAAAIVVSKLAAGATGDKLETIGGVPVWQKAANARGTRATTQSIAHATYTAITLTAEIYDDDTMLDTAGGTPSRITAKTAGKYLCTAGIGWPANANGVRFLSIRKNGTTDFGIQTVQPLTNGVDQCVLATSDIIQLALNDYIECIAYQTSGGGALNCNSAYLSAMRMRD